MHIRDKNIQWYSSFMVLDRLHKAAGQFAVFESQDDFAARSPRESQDASWVRWQAFILPVSGSLPHCGTIPCSKAPSEAIGWQGFALAKIVGVAGLF